MKRIFLVLLVSLVLIFSSIGTVLAMGGGGGGHSQWHDNNRDEDKDGGYHNDHNAPVPVPEPGTLILLGAGLAGLVLYKRRK